MEKQPLNSVLDLLLVYSNYFDYLQMKSSEELINSNPSALKMGFLRGFL